MEEAQGNVRTLHTKRRGRQSEEAEFGRAAEVEGLAV